jgi:hypothetical protein
MRHGRRRSNLCKKDELNLITRLCLHCAGRECQAIVLADEDFHHSCGGACCLKNGQSR